jgi:hypothetical protein
MQRLGYTAFKGYCVPSHVYAGRIAFHNPTHESFVDVTEFNLGALNANIAQEFHLSIGPIPARHRIGKRRRAEDRQAGDQSSHPDLLILRSR